jgi:ATP-binding cassette, subfamily C, bacterial LapB
MTASDQTESPGPSLQPVPEKPASPFINRVHDDIRRIAEIYGAMQLDVADSPNLAPIDEDLLLSSLADAIAPKTAAEACLVPALAAVGWTGVVRELKEALPHFDRIADVDALRSVLARMHYETPAHVGNLQSLPGRLMPCLFSSDGFDVKVLVDRNSAGELLLFDGATTSWHLVRPEPLGGVAYQINPEPHEQSKSDNSRWLGNVLRRFRPIIYKVFLLNFLINLGALALPLFVMHVYDLGITARAVDVVLYLALAAMIVITTDQALRRLRSYAVAYFGARLDAIIAVVSFQQLLDMPIAMTESAPIIMQITRLRQFESIRDVFTGTLATATIDIPFILMFMAVIALIGGHLVWTPIALLAGYAVLAAATIPIISKQLSKTGEAKGRLQQLLLELIGKGKAIRNVNAENVWIARHQLLADVFARLNYKSQLLDGFIQSLSQALVTLSGILTLGFGTSLVLSGAMTTGALIGVMTLVWRVLSPLQSTFLALTRLEQAIQAFKHINRLMEIPGERKPGRRSSFCRRFTGAININRLVFRYPRGLEPVLRGIQLRIAPGEVIAITARSGSGKSTLLKLIAGLYPATAGAILVDGVDVRQLDPAEWRSAIAYAPQTAAFFYGTVSQNIRLACPEASEADVAQAFNEMGLNAFVELFPDGLETRLSAGRLEQLPDAIKQRLLLARCFVKKASVYLLDRPEVNLDADGNSALVKQIANLKSKATVIFTTHRPSHMLLANRVAVIEDGQIVLNGAPEKVLEKLNTAA